MSKSVINQSINQSIHQSINQINPSIKDSPHLDIEIFMKKKKHCPFFSKLNISLLFTDQHKQNQVNSRAAWPEASSQIAQQHGIGCAL